MKKLEKLAHENFYSNWKNGEKLTNISTPIENIGEKPTRILTPMGTIEEKPTKKFKIEVRNLSSEIKFKI